MGISCKVIRGENNRIDVVEAPNGEQSALYTDALNYLIKNDLNERQGDKKTRGIFEESKKVFDKYYEIKRKIKEAGGEVQSSSVNTELIRYAKQQGIWESNIEQEYGKPVAKGQEAYVFDDGAFVVKAFNYSQNYNSFDDFIDKIIIHNENFPESSLNVIGFSKYKGDFVVLMEQPFIEKSRNLTKDEIKSYMESKGYMDITIEELGDRNVLEFTNGEYYITDLDSDNVVRTVDGNVVVIDALVRQDGFNSEPLYQKILSDVAVQSFDNVEERALDIWSVPYTLGFKDINGDWESGNSSLVLDKNGEPKLKDVFSYIKGIRNQGKSLTNKDLSELSNNLYSLPINSLDELYREVRSTFYKNGYFEISKDNLEKSVLYNEVEQLEILSSPILQNKIKNLVEKIENEYISDNSKFDKLLGTYYFNDQDLLQDTNQIVGIGKFKTLNPIETNKIISQYVGGVKNRNHFDNKVKDIPLEAIVSRYHSDPTFAQEFYNRYSNLKKINVFKDVDGVITRKLNNETSLLLQEVLLSDVNDKTLIKDIEFLNEIPVEVWDNSAEEVKGILQDIESKLVQYNLDVVGLQDTYDEKSYQEVLDFVNVMGTFVSGLDTSIVEISDIDLISNVIDVYFGKNVEGRVIYDVVEGISDRRTLVEVNPTSTELDLFKSTSLIKTVDGYYHKVRVINDPVVLYDTVYELITQDNSLLPKEAFYPTAYNVRNEFDRSKLNDISNKANIQRDIRRFVLQKMYDYDSQVESENIQDLEKLILYKMIFKHPLNEEVTLNYDEEFSRYNNFKGNFGYLSTDFVADFYNYVLQQKSNNTELYNEVLRHFEFGERGIMLNNKDQHTLQQINLLSPSNKIFNDLRQYSLISKDSGLRNAFEIDITVSELDDVDFKRVYYSNNPDVVPYYKGNYSVNDDLLITTNTQMPYIRTKNGLFERIQEQGNAVFYRQLPIVENPYMNNYGVKISVNKEVSFNNYKDHITVSPTNMVEFNKLYNKGEASIIKQKIDECG